MTDDSVPEADWLKYSEIQGMARVSLGGARPIRKRGFYRALKRKELWAVTEYGLRDLMNKMAREFYGPIIGDIVHQENKMAGLSEMLSSAENFITLPISYGVKTKVEPK